MSMYLWTALSGYASSIVAFVLSAIIIPIDVVLSLVMPRPAAAEPRTVVSTGATSGIGKALAVSYAKPGSTIVISGRSLERLAETEAECKALGAKVVSKKVRVPRQPFGLVQRMPCLAHDSNRRRAWTLSRAPRRSTSPTRRA